ncbi:Uncharacterised protein [Bordetella pertussis]|nr:Uncharacterised protein [Bordetella pertussis]
MTVTSLAGSCNFISRPKYRPAGPPPRQTIFIALHAPWQAPPCPARTRLICSTLDSLGLKYIP